MRGGDVEQHNFVGARFAVGSGEFGRDHRHRTD